MTVIAFLSTPSGEALFKLALALCSIATPKAFALLVRRELRPVLRRLAEAEEQIQRLEELHLPFPPKPEEA